MVTQKLVDECIRQSTEHGFTRENADALMFEHVLIWSKIARKPLNWRHDFIYNNMKIDAKELPSIYFNIQNGKMQQYRESIIQKDLTHFLFYNSDRDKTKVLIPGDVVTITPLALCDARSIIKAALPSDKPQTEAFVPAEILKTLGETFETIN